MDASNIEQAQSGGAVTEIGVAAGAGIGQHGGWGQAAVSCAADLLESDLGLGPECDLLGDPGLAAPDRIIRPWLR